MKLKKEISKNTMKLRKEYHETTEKMKKSFHIISGCFVLKFPIKVTKFQVPKICVTTTVTLYIM